jgi:hypothetical protein
MLKFELTIPQNGNAVIQILFENTAIADIISSDEVVLELGEENVL